MNEPYRTIRKMIHEKMNRSNVRLMLDALGVKVNRHGQFISNPSFSIHKNGMIKDFGSTDFYGDIVAYMIEILNVNPKQALVWCATVLGVSHDIA